MKSFEVGSHSLQISQAVFEEFDSVDVARDADEYNTNAIILVGCKVGLPKFMSPILSGADFRNWFQSGKRFRTQLD